MRTLLLLAFAILVATCNADPVYAQDGGAPASPNDAAVMAEADFIKKMVEGTDDKGGKKGGEKPAGEKAAEKPAAKKKEEEAGGDRDGDEVGDADADDGADDGEGEEGDDDTKLDADDAEGEEEAAGDDVDKEDDGAEDSQLEGEEGAETDEDADGELDDVEADDEPSPKLEAALKKHGAKAVLEQLPKGLRPVVEKRLKEMEAPYTRAMQEATAFRAERATLVADKKFRDENPVDAVLELLLSDPSLGEKVNARLDEIGESETNRAAHDVVVKDKKEKALKAAEGETAKEDRQAARIQQVEAYVRKESDRLGIPLEFGVEEAVALHIMDRGDITREDIDRILRAKKKQADGVLRGAKRGNRRKYVDEKLKDRRTAGLKVKPNRGAAPAPGSKKTAKTDDEFLAEMDGKLAGMGL